MNRKLTDYLELLETCEAREDWHKVKRICLQVLTKLPQLSPRPIEEFCLHKIHGTACYNLSEFCNALVSFGKASQLAEGLTLPDDVPISVIHMMTNTLIGLRNFDQALVNLVKVLAYYEASGKSPQALLAEHYYKNTLISQAYCRFYMKDMQGTRDIFEQKLDPYVSGFERDQCFIDYCHLKAEYVQSQGRFNEARELFQKCVAIADEIGYPVSKIEANIHLALIHMHDGDIDEAMANLKGCLKLSKKNKINNLFCESALLLGRCYSVKGLDKEADAIERRIKPVLGKLDIVWLYEKRREFDVFFRRLDEATRGNGPSANRTRKVLSEALDRRQMMIVSKDLLIGESKQMEHVFHMISEVSTVDFPVLIQGETGTGKELVARAIHQGSPRSRNIWLAFNCGAIPENLIESSLFGHEKGAFTGAGKATKGYIEIASEGTLFLDEISDMPQGMQQKLLRAIEERRIWRVGAEHPIPINTRFIFASNQDVERLVKEGFFRQDLFFRINVITLTLPPLRNRSEDIPMLVGHFLRKYFAEKPPVVSDEALALLAGYSWPGNVRELENEARRIAVFHKGSPVIDGPMLSEHIVKYPNPASPGNSRLGRRTLKGLRNEYERSVITDALKECGFNVTRTARSLGLGRTAFYKKIAALGLDVKKPSQ